MTPWALAAALYGAVLAFAALTHPIRHRHLSFAGSIAYALAALATGSLGGSFWVQLFVPAALLLTGYWLSGLFFRDPQPWLERWLLHVDHALGAKRWMRRLPRVLTELLELAYAGAYALVGGGAIYAATEGVDALNYYWMLVLASALASYAPLPWLRTRPPRAIEPMPYGRSTAGPYLRRLNMAITNNASIQANTLPSGHVSGGVAAALGVMAFDPVVGWWLMGLAGAIAIAAIAGRYHYVVDCVAGAALALAFSSLM